MYLWDERENLMMPEYLEILPSVKSVYKNILPRTLFRHMQNTSIPPLILGDLAYPDLALAYLKPYGDLNPHEKRYTMLH